MIETGGKRVFISWGVSQKTCQLVEAIRRKHISAEAIRKNASQLLTGQT